MGFEEALEKFRAVIDNKRDLLLVDLLIETGCRVSELLGLRSSDIKNRYLILSSKGETRRLKISKNLYEKIKENEGLLFESNGKPVSKRRVEQIFSEYSKKAGVKITPNKIRNYYLNKLLESRPEEEIRKKTGLKAVNKPVIKIDNLNFPSKERDLLIFAVLFETGCKTRQLVTLKVGDVIYKCLNFGGIRANISWELYHKLIKFCRGRQKDEPLFLQRKNKAITPRRVQQIIANCSNNKLTPSGIRKHFIYRQIKKGKNLDSVKKLVGVKRVDAYTHGIKEVNYGS